MKQDVTINLKKKKKQNGAYQEKDGEVKSKTIFLSNNTLGNTKKVTSKSVLTNTFS